MGGEGGLEGRRQERGRGGGRVPVRGLLVGRLFNVPATCLSISGTDLLNFTRRHTEIKLSILPTVY